MSSSQSLSPRTRFAMLSQALEASPRKVTPASRFSWLADWCGRLVKVSVEPADQPGWTYARVTYDQGRIEFSAIVNVTKQVIALTVEHFNCQRRAVDKLNFEDNEHLEVLYAEYDALVCPNA